MSRGKRAPSLVDWLLSFRIVRLVLGFACGATILGIADAALVGYLAGPNHVIVARVLFVLFYIPAAALAVYLWLWYDRRQRFRMHSLDQLLHLTPTQFEGAVGDLLHDLGYRDVRRVGGAGDLAADLFCRDAQGRSVVVQCKRYAPGKRIGSPTMQSFIGMVVVHHRAERGIFVTTSDFTQPAANLARDHNIALIDGEELGRLIEIVHRRGHEGRTAGELPGNSTQISY